MTLIRLTLQKPEIRTGSKGPLRLVKGFSVAQSFLLSPDPLAAAANKDKRESPGPSVSTWVPLVVVVTVLLVAVLLLGYRYVHLKRKNSHPKLDSIGLVDYEKQQDESFVADEFVG